MPRIAGIDVPENKRVEYSLQYIYGIGPVNVYNILEKAGVLPGKRAKLLSEDEVAKIQKAIDVVKVEGDLRKDVSSSISRLKEIGSYRGTRHAKNLPGRGQRTRTNARTKRGKRVTIGAMKKEMAAKIGGAADAKADDKAKK